MRSESIMILVTSLVSNNYKTERKPDLDNIVHKCQVKDTKKLLLRITDAQ
jgi:hypothetical protein